MEKSRTRAARWLDLIADGAPASAFDAVRDAALAAAKDESEREAIAEEAARAHALRATLTERSRRSRELAALHDITSQLTALRDPERLLQDIAVRARDLLGVDISYLALRNDDGDLTIRVAAGSMGTTLRGLVMSQDSGLAGQIITYSEPRWSRDYTADTTIKHTDLADTAARDEGLGGILGVPLRVRDDVIGALFAADRQVRDFDESEVALLVSLAGHAAAAIDNARLYESLLSTASDLEAANEELRRRFSVTDRAAALHEQLTGIVVRGGGVAEITAAVSNVLGDEVYLRRPDDSALGFDPAGRGQLGGRETTVHEVEDAGLITVAPVVVGEDVLGWLVAKGDLTPSDADLRLLERAALVTALVLVRDRSLQAAERRARHELVGALLRGQGSIESLQRRAVAAGLKPMRPHVIVVSSPEDGAHPAAAAEVEALVEHFGGVTADFEDEVVAIVESPDGAEVGDWLRQRSTAGRTTVGIAEARPGIAALRSAHDEARRCVVTAATLGRRGKVVAPADLGIYRFLLGSAQQEEAQGFIDRVLGRLDAADAERGTDLVATIDAYLDAGRHHGATAETLHIHPNTLYQRFGRVSEVLGEEWRQEDRLLELHLALRLRRVARELGAGADA